MFTAALPTMAKTTEGPKCPSIDRWIKICVLYTPTPTPPATHTHNGIYSTIKKNEIMPSAAKWMDLGIIILSEVSQTEKDK